MKLTIFLAIALLGMAAASCPNSCSGHGTCGNEDQCTCHTRMDGITDREGNTVKAFLGPDCSQRTCPYGKSWADTPFANNVAHRVAECSDAGVCDRKTGLCECFPGYEGRACDRTVCPNSCSGHGTCQNQKQFYVDHTDASGGTVAYSSAWDATKIYGCKCEASFEGPDCSLVKCPSGADPQGGPDGDGFNPTSAPTKTYFRPCSGRGTCDSETGLCVCHSGFYGDACNLQTALI